MNDHGLPLDWVVRPAIDRELKQYLLLAYLQRVRLRFNERKLYPYMEELRCHLDTLTLIRDRKEQLAKGIHGPLLGFDPLTGAARYERSEENEELGVISDVIELALPGMQRMLALGEEMKLDLQDRIRLAPIGVQPLRPTEGWILLRMGSEVRAYSYSTPLVQGRPQIEAHKAVITHYVSTYTVSLSQPYEWIKADLCARRKELPNAALFVLETDAELPYMETFIPLARQLVHDFITAPTVLA